MKKLRTLGIACLVLGSTGVLLSVFILYGEHYKQHIVEQASVGIVNQEVAEKLCAPSFFWITCPEMTYNMLVARHLYGTQNTEHEQQSAALVYEANKLLEQEGLSPTLAAQVYTLIGDLVRPGEIMPKKSTLKGIRVNLTDPMWIYGSCLEIRPGFEPCQLGYERATHVVVGEDKTENAQDAQRSAGQGAGEGGEPGDSGSGRSPGRSGI